jgi:uncharacterized protein (DUF433 family)
MRKTAYPHLGRNPRIAGGAPIVEGTRITVRAIAGHYQLGMSVDEILQSLPHLTQSHVHAALAFYFDHQKEIDRDLERNADLDYWRKQVKQPASVVAKAGVRPCSCRKAFTSL